MISIRRVGALWPSASVASRRSSGSVEVAAMVILEHRYPAVVTRSPNRRSENGWLKPPRSLTNLWVYCAEHSCTHQEGWRDWPYETPATSRKGKVPIPSGSNDKPGRCG